MKKDPENPELPYTLAQARVQQAKNLLDVSDTRRAPGRSSTRRSPCSTRPARGKEQNPAMQFRLFQAYRLTKAADLEVPRTAT